jgi:hypothetical protein
MNAMQLIGEGDRVGVNLATLQKIYVTIKEVGSSFD